MGVDAATFREALGRFASGVCVVTTLAGDNEPTGVTITSFASLSLDPPLVLFCIGCRSTSIDAFVQCKNFVVNVLSAEQEKISELFASQRVDKFCHAVWHKGENDCPLLTGCLGSIECKTQSVHPGGDHFIITGNVERFAGLALDLPLLRFRGRYYRLGNEC